MSIDRQFGMHEIPGTEEPAPAAKRETVSAGFELQMRGYVNQIWSKLGELEEKLAALSELREAKGERYGDEFGQKRPGVRAAPPKPSLNKPWEAEGVSRRTWHRRHKGA